MVLLGFPITSKILNSRSCLFCWLHINDNITNRNPSLCYSTCSHVLLIKLERSNSNNQSWIFLMLHRPLVKYFSCYITTMNDGSYFCNGVCNWCEALNNSVLLHIFLNATSIGRKKPLHIRFRDWTRDQGTHCLKAGRMSIETKRTI